MPTEVLMPQMGESIFEGTITKWLKKPGDTVQRDEPLFEISTDKVDAEIPSPAAGVLSEIKAAEGSTVQVNSVVAIIGDGAGAAGSNGAGAPAPAKIEEVKAAPAPAEEAQPPVPAEAAPGSSGAQHDVIMPQMGESIFEGTITKWLKQVGDKVERDEPLFEISTDKVDAEIPSPAAGTLSEIKVQAGQTAQINTVVAVIGGAAGAAPAAKPAAAKPAAAAPVTAAQGPAAAEEAEPVSAEAEHVRSSPLVRKIARENNVNLAAVPGSGAGGRVTKEDILSYVEKGGAPAAAPARPAAPAPAAPSAAAAAAPAMAKPAAAPAAAATPIPGELVPLS